MSSSSSDYTDNNFIEIIHIPIKEGYGYVYHLLNQINEIIYIGHTTNIYERFGSHVINKKNIHKIRAWEFPIESLLNETADQIIKHKPKLNTTMPPNDYWMTRETYQRINPIVKGQMNKIKRIMAEFGFEWQMNLCLNIEQWEVIAQKLECGDE